jgi:hypothetical protein
MPRVLAGYPKLPPRRREEIPVGCQDVGLRRGVWAAAPHEWVAHERAIVLAQAAFARDTARGSSEHP